MAFGTPVGADYVVSKNNTDNEIGPNPVMLSAAKHLFADRDRPFAALRVTPGGSSMHDNAVMLSAAKHLDAHPGPSLHSG